MDELVEGRWRVGAALASGGWGEVLEARDEVSGAEAALLLLDRERPDAALGDPALLAGLEHPNIARVRAWGRVARGPGPLVGRPYVALEPLRGQTLRAALAAGRLDPARLGRLALDLLAALEAAHALGLRQRRLAPEQVLLDPGGAKLLGVGAPADRGDAQVAPEVARGGDGDVRADLYALGACLYEAATGRPPDRLVFVPARDLRPDLPPALERAIAALLEDDPRARPASAGAARALFAQALGQPPGEAGGDASLEPRFVGREEAVEAIAGAVDEAEALAAAGRAAREAAPAGPPPFVVLAAAPGLGRTRLLAEAAAQLARRGVLVLRAQAFGGGDPFEPWRAVLEAARRQAQDEAADAVAQAAEALAGPAQGGALAGWERVARGLLALAARRPAALLLDDAHLLGEPAVALLLHVARAAQAPGAGGALAVVAAAASDEQQGEPPLLRALAAPLAPAHRLARLGPLAPAQAAALVRSLVPDEAAVERLVGLGAGDPSLLVELARARRRGGGPPGSLEEAARARLARAAPAARPLLEALAVVGRPVQAAALADLAAPGVDAVEVLRVLLAAGLVRRHDGPAYDLRRRAHPGHAQGRARPARRGHVRPRAGRARSARAPSPRASARLMLQARLDGAAEAALAAAPGDPAPEEVLAGAADLMPPGLARARVRRELAARLRARGAFAAARAALEAALADAGEQDALEAARAHLELGEVAMAEGRTREALERSTRGARGLDGQGGPEAGATLARLLALEARAVTQLSDHAGAARLLARAKAALERDRDPALYARLEVDEANAWVLSLDRTRYDAARARLEALLPRLDAAGDQDGAVHCLRALGNLAYYVGDMGAAEERFRDALGRCERQGDLPVLAGLWNNLGLVARMQGELRRAEAALERALDIAERLGQGAVICRALTNVGRVRRALGDLRGAARSLRQAAEVARAVGDVMIESAAWSELGTTRLAEGRTRAALGALLRARRLRRALGDPGRVGESELDLAELWRKTGDVRAALAATARSMALQASLGNGDAAALAVEALEFATAARAARRRSSRRRARGRARGPPPCPRRSGAASRWRGSRAPRWPRRSRPAPATPSRRASTRRAPGASSGACARRRRRRRCWPSPAPCASRRARCSRRSAPARARARPRPGDRRPAPPAGAPRRPAPQARSSTWPSATPTRRAPTRRAPATPACRNRWPSGARSAARSSPPAPSASTRAATSRSGRPTRRPRRWRRPGHGAAPGRRGPPRARVDRPRRRPRRRAPRRRGPGPSAPPPPPPPRGWRSGCPPRSAPGSSGRTRPSRRGARGRRGRPRARRGRPSRPRPRAGSPTRTARARRTPSRRRGGQGRGGRRARASARGGRTPPTARSSATARPCARSTG
ncbi:MAG: tetratricopeptide repeat protein [Planctomycetes bacterium]|nr:tetratricopeptide repeat protein [Planctomycetota bacterium]